MKKKFMIKYLNEHINIIKSNFNDLILQEDDINFFNYSINTQITLNNVLSNALLLKNNYDDYKKILLNKNKM